MPTRARRNSFATPPPPTDLYRRTNATLAVSRYPPDPHHRQRRNVPLHRLCNRNLQIPQSIPPFFNRVIVKTRLNFPFPPLTYIPVLEFLLIQVTNNSLYLCVLNGRWRWHKTDLRNTCSSVFNDTPNELMPNCVFADSRSANNSTNLQTFNYHTNAPYNAQIHVPPH